MNRVDELTIYHIHISIKDIGPNLQELYIRKSLGLDQEILLEKITKTDHKGDVVSTKFEIVTHGKEKAKANPFNASFRKKEETLEEVPSHFGSQLGDLKFGVQSKGIEPLG